MLVTSISGGGSGATTASMLPVTPTASSERSGGNYPVQQAVNMALTSRGWMQANSEDTGNPYVEMDLGSTKSVKYLMFGVGSGENYGTAWSKSDISVTVATATSGSYSTLFTETFHRNGTTPFFYSIYPINQSAQKVKVTINYISGENLSQGIGYKMAVFGE